MQMLQLLRMPCCTKVVSTGYSTDVETGKLHYDARIHIRVTPEPRTIEAMHPRNHLQAYTHVKPPPHIACYIQIMLLRQGLIRRNKVI
mmetsp:Transcript_4547/g.28862  ORF Transcript_4547/g.28862 Transcript_4547/m.28862 type:complete len:88 (+) Transcript_4547:184-447(+)